MIFVSQVPLIFFSQFRHSNKFNLILFNIINFIFNVAGVYFTINSFRAAWYLLDLYFFTSFKIISWVGGQILGLIILILLRLEKYIFIKNFTQSFLLDAQVVCMPGSTEMKQIVEYWSVITSHHWHSSTVSVHPNSGSSCL